MERSWTKEFHIVIPDDYLRELVVNSSKSVPVLLTHFLSAIALIQATGYQPITLGLAWVIELYESVFKKIWIELAINIQIPFSSLTLTFLTWFPIIILMFYRGLVKGYPRIRFISTPKLFPTLYYLVSIGVVVLYCLLFITPLMSWISYAVAFSTLAAFLTFVSKYSSLQTLSNPFKFIHSDISNKDLYFISVTFILLTSTLMNFYFHKKYLTGLFTPQSYFPGSDGLLITLFLISLIWSFVYTSITLGYLLLAIPRATGATILMFLLIILFDVITATYTRLSSPGVLFKGDSKEFGGQLVTFVSGKRPFENTEEITIKITIKEPSKEDEEEKRFSDFFSAKIPDNRKSIEINLSGNAKNLKFKLANGEECKIIDFASLEKDIKKIHIKCD